MANLFVVGSRNPEILALTLAGLAWSERPVGRTVIVIVANGDDPAIGRTQRVAEEFASLHSGFDVLRVPIECRPISPGYCIHGAGAALYEACRAYPSDVYVKVDDDMFVVTRDWLPRMLATRADAGTDLAVGMTNMNGMCAQAFVNGIGGSWGDVPTELPWILYPDVASQRVVWEMTLRRWERVLTWGDRRHSVVRHAGFRNTNSVAFGHEWLERRTREDFYVVGEDERALNETKPGDCADVAWDQGALLLHWGYTPARDIIAYMWPEVRTRLTEHWCG